LRKFINDHEKLIEEAFEKINKDLRPENKEDNKKSKSKY
jgi:hypothetical protein